jgi:ATP-dependent Clp protease adapter protein ClpS
MNNLPKTQEELMLLYMKSVTKLLDAVREKEKELKKSKDNDPITVKHYTTRLLQDWFRNKGGLPIPD